MHATFVVEITSRSQKKNIFKTSSPSLSYSHSYSSIVGRGICLFCAHSQFFSLSIELAPDHLVDHPATDTPVCPESFSQSGNPALSLFCRTPCSLPDCPTNEHCPHSGARGVTHKEMWHLKSCFLPWMDERSNVVWI